LLDSNIFVATVNHMSKDRGRPPKDPVERKSAELRIRLTDADRAILDAAAGTNTSAWARKLLLKAAAGQRKQK